MISKEQITEIIDKTDIVDLVSQYVQLEKSGAGFRGLCPFHSEKTPSFMVSPTKKIAKCMGCGVGGNPITFLKEIKKISFEEAAIELASKAGIKLEGLRNNKKGPNYAHFYEIMETSKKFYMHNLLNTKSGEAAIEYLHKRGINDENIKRFEIGLSLNSQDSLYKVLKEKGYNELDMINLGLIKTNEQGKFYDLFKNRIMFPVKDENGNTIAYSARIFNNPDKTQPKYVNSPESLIFKKHLTLYHLSDAISDIRKLHQIVLHEGQMDVIASVRSGFNEAVCSMGTSLTHDQVSIMKKYAEKVIVCYDGDNAGIEAMLKAIKLLEQASLQTKLVILPNGDDPDSFVLNNGEEAFRNFINNNQLDPLDFIFEYSTRGKDFTKISDVESAKKTLFENLRNNNSRVSIERYISLLADKINVSQASLLMDFNNYYTPSQSEKIDEFLVSRNEKIELLDGRKYLTANAWAELRLLNYAKLSKAKANEIESKFPDGDIMPYLEPIHQELWDELTCSYYARYDQFVEAVFVMNLSDRLHSCYMQNINSLYNNADKLIPYNSEDMKYCIEMLISYQLIKQIDKIDKMIDTSSGSKKVEYLTSKLNLVKKYNQSQKQKKGRL